MSTTGPRRARVPRQRPDGVGSQDLRRRALLERVRGAVERHRARQPEIHDPARRLAGDGRNDMLDLLNDLRRGVDAFVAALTDGGTNP